MPWTSPTCRSLTYGYVFQTSPPEDAREFAKNREVPRPYVFEPPDGTKMEYAPGERMRFGFTVVGRVEYAGPVEEFLPLLHIGQLTHAGKRAVFGLGRYRLRES